MKHGHVDTIPEPVEDDRLEKLPEWEDDHARGVDREMGAGVLFVGGTAEDRGEALGVARPPGEEVEAEDDPLPAAIIPTVAGLHIKSG
jgi:hypothetical protein